MTALSMNQNLIYFAYQDVMITKFFQFLSYICTLCNRFRDKLGVKVIKALKRNDDGVTHAAIDMLCALMQVKKQ